MEGWRRIRVSRLVWFLNEAPAGLRWRLDQPGPGPGLVVVLPRGQRWRIKIRGGCLIRKEDEYD